MKCYLVYSEDGQVVQRINARVAPLLRDGLTALEVDPQDRLSAGALTELRINLAGAEPVLEAQELPAEPEYPQEVIANIKGLRDQLEQSPITLTIRGVECSFDYDRTARERLENADSYWDQLVYTKSAYQNEEHIVWALSDNSTVMLSESDLTAVVLNLSMAAAMRADALHAHARELIQDYEAGNLDEDYLDPATWPVAGTVILRGRNRDQ